MNYNNLGITVWKYDERMAVNDRYPSYSIRSCEYMHISAYLTLNTLQPGTESLIKTVHWKILKSCKNVLKLQGCSQKEWGGSSSFACKWFGTYLFKIPAVYLTHNVLLLAGRKKRMSQIIIKNSLSVSFFLPITVFRILVGELFTYININTFLTKL